MPDFAGLILDFPFDKTPRTSTEVVVVLADLADPEMVLWYYMYVPSAAYTNINIHKPPSQWAGTYTSTGYFFPAITGDGGKGSRALQ